MVLGDESEFRVGEQADTRGAHHDSRLATPLDVAKFRALLDFVMPNKSITQVAKAFEGRVSRASIGHWRTGHQMPPKWILDRLRELAIDRVRQLATIKTNVPPGATGARVLASYMARRARERDAKKKPG